MLALVLKGITLNPPSTRSNTSSASLYRPCVERPEEVSRVSLGPGVIG
jgi:hypothetical protein